MQNWDQDFPPPPMEQCTTAAATVTDHDLLQLPFMQSLSPPISTELIDCHTPNSPTALLEIFSDIVDDAIHTTVDYSRPEYAGFLSDTVNDSAVNFYFSEYARPEPKPNLVEEENKKTELQLQEVSFSNDAANWTIVEPTITKSLSYLVNSDSSAVNLPETPEPEPEAERNNFGRRPQLRVGRWTKDEQMSFSMGLKKYGYGNWKKIASEFVPSRTHIQVGSHAQKYFNHHQNRPNWKSCSSRSSIFDITIVDSHSKAPTVQPPSPPWSPPHQQFTVTYYSLPPDHQRN